MTKISDRLKKPGTPLRMKLFWYLAVFFMFVILLMWLFQVVLMDSFYRAVTVGEMKESAKVISSVISSGGDFDVAALAAAEESGACVSVYMVKNGSGTEIADAHVRNGCFIHSLMSGDQLGMIYSETADAHHGLVTEITAGDEGAVTGLLYSGMIEDKGTEYLMMFNTEAFPMGATASTITVQLTLITVILLIGAAVLAIMISLKITRPMSALSREAAELAAGDYSIDPAPGGILEINQLGETLSHAAAELERSAQMRQDLIANITHDLRTPLTMISGYSEVMRDIPGEVTPENLQVIIDESARLSALVNDVLEVSKAQSGIMSLNLTQFCITDTVKAVAERYGEMLRVRGYTVIYESDGVRAVTWGDETKLMQAFCNLLNNGVNFTGENRRVVVRQFVHGGLCRTEVTDFGAGIPAEELERIWDRYYRARDRQNKGVPGSGLGLSIVKQIMLLHDASFGVTSTPGEGSTFWFEVPVVG